MVAGSPRLPASATKSYEKTRKFKDDWKKQYPWVSESKDGKAYCSICNSVLDPKKSRLEAHQSSGKHQDNLPKMNHPKITETPSAIIISQNDSVKLAEMHLAAEIAVHCPTVAIDHISEAISMNSQCTRKGCFNPLTNIQLHRTKCTKIISNVIAKYLKSNLKNSLDKHYSVMIDEWSDLSYKPYLAIIISYSEKNTGTIKQSFLAIRDLEKTNADSIFGAMKTVLEEFGLQLENCISYASDGAAVVSGSNNSVFTRLREYSPHVLQIKCICHSIAKCAEHAFNKLPSCLAFLMKAIPKWFSKSNVRKNAYLELYSSFDTSKQFSNPFQKYAETRWLVRGKVCRNLLNNWGTLKEYFEKALPDLRPDQKFNCLLILENLNDQNLAYFKFVTPIIESCERANLLFQKEKIDPKLAFEEVSLLFQSILRRTVNSRGHAVVVENTNFGTEFSDISPPLEVMQRCRFFLDELVLQLNGRLQHNLDCIMSLNLLSPTEILVNKPLFKNLPKNPLKTDTVEEQYNQIDLINWKEFADEPTKMFAEDFWIMVLEKKGEKFAELARYSLLSLSISLSNATVERIFSQAGAVKTKLRNAITPENLDAFVRVRAYRGKDCYRKFDFTPLLPLFNNDMYHK